uniref:NADH-ubiquinone oxidoreductase chain 6 n=1 Tax=Attagenus hottentotus TaxID=1205591 RepID=A0A0S2MRS7_9COLE|nr:NADH deshydrogenase subunit 6 [Attagenus hottentotus]
MTATMIMLLSTSLSIMFPLLKHPMSMGLTLLMQSLMITMISGLFFKNFWYSYILFLIMVGGLLVLFIYMTSIASNEKFKFSTKLAMSLMMYMSLIITIMLIEPFLMTIINNTEDMMKQMIKNSWELSMTKFIMWPTNQTMMMIIIYLLLCLIAVVKIINMKYGALRQKL